MSKIIDVAKNCVNLTIHGTDVECEDSGRGWVRLGILALEKRGCSGRGGGGGKGRPAWWWSGNRLFCCTKKRSNARITIKFKKYNSIDESFQIQ